MKNTNFNKILPLLMFFISVASFSQTQVFLGTWEHQTGNSIFRVIITSNTFGDETISPLMGRYLKVSVNNGVETLIYSSDRAPIGNFMWEPGFYGSLYGNNLLGGTLTDNTYQDSSKHKWGDISMTINTTSCSACPLTANWKVTRPSGLRLDNEPLEYNIPTNIVLTKQ